jgi:hypothetical protein
MDENRFPYEKCQWNSGEPERQRRWCEVLEPMGVENVRARLAQTDAGSPGAISIGTEHALTIGFAQEWLAWHDRHRVERETLFRSRQIFWTRWAALAASVAAAATAIGWLITIIWRKS